MCANIKNFKSLDGLNITYRSTGWMYIGRGDRRLGLERSVLANPYSHLSKANAIKCESREEAIKRYRKWLWEKIQDGDKEVMLALLSVKKSTALVCYCDPLPCHGAVVRKAAEWLQSVVAAK